VLFRRQLLLQLADQLLARLHLPRELLAVLGVRLRLELLTVQLLLLELGLGALLVMQADQFFVFLALAVEVRLDVRDLRLRQGQLVLLLRYLELVLANSLFKRPILLVFITQLLIFILQNLL